MFFILSKTLGGVIFCPFNAVTILLLIGLVILFKSHAPGRTVIAIGIALLFICGVNSVPRHCIALLENRIPAARIPDEIDGIIVLSGMVNKQCSRNGLIELNSSADRIINGLILAKRYPDARLVISGGAGSLLQNESLKEADYLKRLSIDLGIREERIVIERESRNTYEHSQKLPALIEIEHTWILVTSAYHMPRALGCFRKAGFNVLPYPVDYQNRLDTYYAWSDFNTFFPSPANIQKITIALHEWAGLAAYRLLGYTDSFFPKG